MMKAEYSKDLFCSLLCHNTTCRNCQVEKLFEFLRHNDLLIKDELKGEPDLCGNCKHRDDKWSECEVYHMHVDLDEVRDCRDFEDVKE